jgi:hypothetical protein
MAVSSFYRRPLISLAPGPSRRRKSVVTVTPLLRASLSTCVSVNLFITDLRELQRETERQRKRPNLPIVAPAGSAPGLPYHR